MRCSETLTARGVPQFGLVAGEVAEMTVLENSLDNRPAHAVNDSPDLR